MDQGMAEAQALLVQQGRINTSVQQGLMGTLMVPFSRQVARLQRVVRQTAADEGKVADVVFEGVESELDRNVLERMTAPLEHLLRNAVVHGIEPVEARLVAGKPAAGTVRVRLQREGTQLAMEISDDGRGLDYLAIRAKAIERGLLRAEASLTDDELARFIFEPGFSTAGALTQSAGRGVGMDVVASEVKQLGGAVELRSSVGQGTRFTVRLPLSLALSQALMVQVGDETYALPLVAVEGTGRVPREAAQQAAGGGEASVDYADHSFRVRHLAGLIGLPVNVPEDVRHLPAVLVRLGEGVAGGERRAALVVDKLIGNREVVSKAVGPQLSSISGVAGATILPGGEVVLILDPAALVLDHARQRLLAEAEARQRPVHLAPEPADGGRLVMVVDDSVTMRRVAERLLLRQGYRVITAKDGLDAMALLQNEFPAAILLDIEMPRADGFEVAGFVRNSERLADTPIIMITSRSGDKHRNRAMALGVNRYLIKPYQEDELLHELRVLLQAREAALA
jgi:chemosensory pili system protein ChpA (sensor histidine kinase/response regulator)